MVGLMPRTERTEKIRIHVAQGPESRCAYVIRLPAGEVEIEYRCARYSDHGGAHDANVVHPHDEYLVRW